MKLNYDHYLFDLDGTLVNSTCEIFSAAKKTCQNNNLNVPSFEYFKKKVGVHPDIFFLDHGATNNIDGLVDEFRNILFKEAGDPKLVFKGAAELLQLLYKKNKRISLATTKPTFLARTLIKRYGIDHYFSFVQGTEKNIRPKPKPDMIFKCLSKNSELSSVMIGDTISDILAAKNADIDSIGVTTGACNKKELSNTCAIMVVDDLSSLIKFF